ncbi:MAG: thiamine pyrophosphate-binding protein, partial [Candidatus Caldarchaeum sp.]
PYEVLYESCGEEMLAPYQTAMPDFRVSCSRNAVAEIAQLLKGARRPVLIAGSGTWYSGAEAELIRFLELAPIPSFTLNFGRGIIPDNHPLCFGAASPSAPVAFKRVTSEADLIILLGIRLSLYIGWGRTFNPDAKIIQIDIDPGEIGRNRPSDLGIVSDIKRALELLIEHLETTATRLDYGVWIDRAIEWRMEEWSKVESIRNSNQKPIHPVRVVKAVEDVIGEEGMLVIDGGETQVWADTTYQVLKPGHYVKGGPLGCMGVGVPFALGTKVASPDKPVALISGDGAIGMNIMEFETAIRHNIPFVAVVCNDQAWGMTKHQFELSYGEAKKVGGLELPFIPYHEIVRVLGGHGELVAEPDELAPAIERAFASGKPSLINVPTDSKAISPSTYVLTQMMMPKKHP